MEDRSEEEEEIDLERRGEGKNEEGRRKIDQKNRKKEEYSIR